MAEVTGMPYGVEDEPEYFALFVHPTLHYHAENALNQ